MGNTMVLKKEKKGQFDYTGSTMILEKEKKGRGPT